MTVNDVDAALVGDTIYQNGACAAGAQCTAGETDIGNDGGIVLGNHNSVEQGDATTITSSSANSSSDAGPSGSTAQQASQHNSGTGPSSLGCTGTQS